MELTEGNIPNYYREANKIYDAMRDDENEDVFIFTMPNSIDEFLAMDIKEDPNYLINTECAFYFEKRSVQYVSEPVYVSNDNKTYVRIAPSYFEHDLQFVSIFNNSASQGTEEIQVLEPFDNNLVVEMSSKDTGSVSIYVFADADGREILEEMEISYWWRDCFWLIVGICSIAYERKEKEKYNMYFEFDNHVTVLFDGKRK